MRIPIREQLAALVLLSTLIGLAVISVATWIRNHDLVINLRSSRLEVTASLKASQIAANLALYERSVRGLSTRAFLQEGYAAYNNGTATANNWSDFDTDFKQTGAAQQQLISIQTRLFARDTKYSGYIGGLTNVTVPHIDIKLPYSHPDGTPVKLGDSNGGYPPNLYPNLTYHNNNNDGESDVSFNGRLLNINSTILLGPWQTNSTFALFSITIPVINSSLEVHETPIGWVTLVLNAQYFIEVVDSPVGLDESGTVLLIRPESVDNRFPNAHFNQGDPQVLESAEVKFALPPDEARYSPKRHEARDFGHADKPFRLSAYPAIADGVSMTDPTINSAGSNIDCQNEENKAVSIGYAIPKSQLCQWILVVEQSKMEAFEPIVALRNILLACVFATAGAMALLIYPLAHYASRPIRRLRDATIGAMVSSTESGPNEKEDAAPVAVIINGQEKDTNGVGPMSPVDDKKGNKFKWSPLWRKQPHVDIESQSSGTSFRVPTKVQVGRHLVESELTDLTQKFNEMTDELAAYHTKLEDKVKKRTAQLEESKKAAEVANKSKTLFIANISHELKTPLNGIIGMCGVALQEVANGDFGKIKHTIGVIYNSGDLLHHLLTDLLTFAQNQAGKGLRLHEKEFRLRDLAVQVQAIFHQQVTDRQINFSVTYHGPSDLGDIVLDAQDGQVGPPGSNKVRDMCLWGDFHRLLQVCINLVSNGLKFTQIGGSVHLKIRCVEKARLPAGSDALEPSTSTTVEDRLARLQSYESTEEVDKDDDKDSKSSHIIRKRNSFNSTQSDALDEPPPNAETFWFEFEVLDTGPGIPKHLQRSIFEPFMQGDPELTKKYGGTGLGLSICLQIAKLMHGEIHLESETGHGSNFTLRVPLKLCRIRTDSTAASLARVSISSVDARLVPPTVEETTPAAKAFEGEKNPRLVGLSQPYFSKGSPPMASPTGDSSAKTKLKVLVAEDNKVNQEVVLRMLKLEEIFDVHIAKDGQEALDSVKASMEQESPYDLIFMDIMMPNLDGRQSTRLIRQAGYSAPIVALTAFADEVNQKECMDSGMDYFLSKPIKRPALKHVLKTYCAPIQEMEEAEAKDSSTGNDGSEGSMMAEVNPFELTISNPSRVGALTRVESPELTPTSMPQ